LVSRCVPIDVTPVKWYYPENLVGAVENFFVLGFPSQNPVPGERDSDKLKVKELKDGKLVRDGKEIDISNKNKVIDLMFNPYWGQY
jgi:hypothetical protein